MVSGAYGGPVTGRHLLLRSGASCTHLLLAVIAWVVDRLLSESFITRISLSFAVSSFGSFALPASVWPLLIHKLTQTNFRSISLFVQMRYFC
ncbi:hypothetical protein AGR4C_Cc100059 [Agrobacterium tumefaciens str. Kerr 14]|uniref:Uncharacterized protein n=1 Tax=Agrobacterium tumefaciens str. Kerr 14 TaxID=1183424 RepID=A0A1S7NL65_AGRTU|nr:hypothetical protein AGR4C_Cc100059 [Agrobacterium tumefaciens str. Kerr 14]